MSWSPPPYQPPEQSPPTPPGAPPPLPWGAASGYPGGAPIGWMPPGYGQQWPPPAPPRRGGLTTMLGLAVIVAVVAGLLALVLTQHGASGPRAQLGVESGRVVYSDNLHDPSSGWPSQTLTSGSTIGYENGGYVIHGQGDKSHFTRAPYHTGLQTLGIAVTVIQTTGDPVDAFGVECDHGGDTGNQYAFFLHGDGVWDIDRYVPDPTTYRHGSVVRSGSSSAFNGSTAAHVEAACISITSSGGTETTRLLLSVNGRSLADATDTVSDAGGSLWYGGVMTSTSATQPSVVQFTDFSLRDLEG